jgi:hypothetical protein
MAIGDVVTLPDFLAMASMDVLWIDPVTVCKNGRLEA